jgi:hypothetical protein
MINITPTSILVVMKKILIILSLSLVISLFSPVPLGNSGVGWVNYTITPEQAEKWSKITNVLPEPSKGKNAFENKYHTKKEWKTHCKKQLENR